MCYSEQMGTAFVEPGTADERAHLQCVLVFVQLGEDDEEDVSGQLGEAMGGGCRGSRGGKVPSKVLESSECVEGCVCVYPACIGPTIDSRCDTVERRKRT